MPTTVQLSSSPPRIFARSPTRVDFSSPPRSSKSRLHEGAGLQASCVPARSSRDGFSNGCKRPRRVLGDKLGAENTPISHSPKNAQFKNNSSTNVTLIPHRSPKFINDAPKRNLPQNQAQSAALVDSIEDPECLIVKILPSDLKRNKKPPKRAPTNTYKLPPRRTDWTPPRYATVWDESPETEQLDFGNQLVQFSHVEEDSSFEKLANSVDGEFTKRRRIDLVETKIDPSKPQPTKSARDVKKSTKSRSKSPTKKSLTITGLATSRYLGQELEKSTPMMQYLVSTKAKMGEDQSCGTFETKMKKRTVSKGKKPKSKSRLRSPQTAMQTLDSQELLFASASQLARDEDPSKSCSIDQAPDTANKHLMSDPFPTQQTTVASIESATPKVGTSRYRAHRSLWSAADRDDDNALLHLHDEFESPFLKEAFAGKDALFEEVIVKVPKDSGEVFDISEVTTPVLINSAKAFPSITKRMYSSSTKSPSSKKFKPATRSETEPVLISSDPVNVDESAASHRSTSALEKPDYASWSDENLKQQLKTFGIKGMRKRENMIKRLEMLWAAANGIDYTAAQPLIKVMQQGDFLSKVHDFTQRTTLTTKKPKATKSKATSKEQKAKVKSHKLNEQEIPDEAKRHDNNSVQRREKSGKVLDKNTLSGEKDEEASHASVDKDVKADDEGIEPSTAPVRGTGVKASALPKAGLKLKGKVESRLQPLTPPPTGPPETISFSSPGFEDLTSITSVNTILLQSDQPLKSKILLALKQVNPKGETRNHQLNPTWWEKIQMYDPIVLEDFTVWLNTEGFGAIGEDGEIDANEVKAWCEEVGVCCLWKGGWRGNKIGRTGD